MNDEISGMCKEAIRSTAYNFNEENDKLSRKIQSQAGT